MYLKRYEKMISFIDEKNRQMLLKELETKFKKDGYESSLDILYQNLLIKAVILLNNPQYTLKIFEMKRIKNIYQMINRAFKIPENEDTFKEFCRVCEHIFLNCEVRLGMDVLLNDAYRKYLTTKKRTNPNKISEEVVPIKSSSENIADIFAIVHEIDPTINDLYGFKNAYRFLTKEEKMKLTLKKEESKLIVLTIKAIMINIERLKKEHISINEIHESIQRYINQYSLFYYAKMGIYGRFPNENKTDIQFILTYFSKNNPDYKVAIESKYGKSLVEEKELKNTVVLNSAIMAMKSMLEQKKSGEIRFNCHELKVEYPRKESKREKIPDNKEFH